MTGESISNEELLILFEAARWAPSAGNSQPWRIFYAHRDTPHWSLFFDLLVDRNKAWCRDAAVLLVLASTTTRAEGGRPLPTHSYDTGAAWENLALQGWMSGFVVHGMAGFDYARARQVLRVPEDWRVEAMAAIGRPAPVSVLSEDLQARETPSPRSPIADLIVEGPYRG